MPGLEAGTIILEIKPYVYETVNGKRKRVSPIVIENGVVTEIKERGIVKAINYGQDSPLGPQHTDQEKRFFNPK